MKHMHLYTLLLLSVAVTSCGQNQTSLPPDNIRPETEDTGTATGSNVKYYTQYIYTDPIGMRLIIQNSFPKGGTKYTSPTGEIYNYAIFFTRMINETDKPIELNIDFPVDQYEVPSLPGKYFTILVPPDTMTLDQEPLYAYGLTALESFLNNSMHKPFLLKRTIDPKGSSGLYVVMLCPVEGAHGTMRAGLRLQGHDLFYSIKIDGSKSNTPSSDEEIRAGSINLKNLMFMPTLK